MPGANAVEYGLITAVVARRGSLRNARSIRVLNGDTGTHEVGCAVPRFGSRRRGSVGVSVLRKGEIRGIVAGAERRRRKLRLYFSLDGLTPGAKYRVVVSRRRCSRSSGTPLAIMEDVTEVVLNFGSRLVKRTGSLRKARSIRIGGVCRPFLGGSQDGTGI